MDLRIQAGFGPWNTEPGLTCDTLRDLQTSAAFPSFFQLDISFTVPTNASLLKGACPLTLAYSSRQYVSLKPSEYPWLVGLDAGVQSISYQYDILA